MRRTVTRKPRIGLALGAGVARGWAHIGIVRELVDAGLAPEIVVGASIGSVVGGSYAAGKLDQLEQFARSLTRRRVFRLMDVSFSGHSLIGGGRLRQLLRLEFGNLRIEDLPRRFATVATQVGSGHEIWLTTGDLVDALCASYALPGIFEPVKINGRWLFDGALVNPIPVTVCRALGADFVIAVSLVGDTMYRGTVIRDPISTEAVDHLEASVDEASDEPRKSWTTRLFGGRSRGEPEAAAPGIARIMADAFNIAQDRVARSRLAGDPPDALIHARLGRVGLFDFNRADELIEAGREAVRCARAEIEARILSAAPVE